MQSTRLERRSSNWTGLSRLAEGPLGWLITLLVIPALIVAVLLLPPVSLLDRLQVFTYTRIGAAGGAVSDPDGAMINFPAEGIGSNFYAIVKSVPRRDFLAGQGDQELYEAAGKLPTHLLPKSPFYQVALRGNSPSQAILTIPIPNDSLPYETLGLYSWNGTEWKHLPTLILSEEDRIEARLDFAPANFMVMQTTAATPAVVADLGQTGVLPEGVNVAGEAKAGLTLRGDGALDGKAPANPDGKTIAVIRNWDGDGLTVANVRTDLINNLLLDPGQQENQLTAIEQKVIENNYPGVIIDYRGIDAAPSARADFVHLITKLVERLHAAGKSVSVQVEAPTPISADQWDTKGHDWRGLGNVVDKLIIPAPIDPRAYAQNGEMEALLRFATSEVERRKVQIQLVGQSIERSGPYLLLKGYQDALRPLLGQVQAETGGPMGEIALSLDTPRLKEQVTLDETIGAYRYSYLDDQGFERTVYIENADSLTHKLKLLQEYNVRDVVLFATGTDVDPNIWGVLAQFQQNGELASNLGAMSVVYTVYGADGKTLTNKVVPLDSPRFAFAPLVGGELRVETQLVGSRGEALSAPIPTTLMIAEAGESATTTVPVGEQAAASAEKAAKKVAAKLTATDILNVRSGPGTSFGVLGTVDPGGSFDIIAKAPAGDWWQIDVGQGQKGWVIGQLVSTSGDVDEVAVAEPEAPVAAAAAPASEQQSDQPAAPAEETQPEAPAQAAPAPVISAPPPSGGGSFGYGVQAHMVDAGNEGTVMGLTQGMGFGWVKQQVEWKRFEASEGARDFGPLEGIVNAANGAGISLLFSVVNAPAWAREAGHDASVGGPPANPQTFANFLSALASKYCGSAVKALEVWNEQNLHYEWGNKPLNAGEYVALLAPSYAAIKAACPSMYVISGALTPAGNNPGKAVDDFTYLEEMFKAGVANYADGIGAHPSGYNVPATVGWQEACGAIQISGNSFNGACDSPHHSWSFRSTIEGYRNIMNVYGASDKRIWPTEFGWAAGGAFHPSYQYANDNTFEEQAQWTVEAYQLMRDWGYVGPAFLWNLNFRMVADGTEKAQWGIVNAGGGPLPVYNALAAMGK